MKQRVPYALCKPQLFIKHGKKKRRSQQFDRQRRFENKLGQADDASHLGRRNGFLHGASLHQPDLSPRENGKGARHRHNAQPSDLDQQDNDELAKVGPVGCRIMNHQSRYTDSGCRRKQGVSKWGADAVLC